VRGWVAYYRTVVSAKVFSALTDYLWKLTYKWACWNHPNKPKRWIVDRYFRKFEKFRNDRWVFGDKDTGAYLPKPAWTVSIQGVQAIAPLGHAVRSQLRGRCVAINLHAALVSVRVSRAATSAVSGAWPIRTRYHSRP